MTTTKTEQLERIRDRLLRRIHAAAGKERRILLDLLAALDRQRCGPA